MINWLLSAQKRASQTMCSRTRYRIKTKTYLFLCWIERVIRSVLTAGDSIDKLVTRNQWLNMFYDSFLLVSNILLIDIRFLHSIRLYCSHWHFCALHRTNGKTIIEKRCLINKRAIDYDMIVVILLALSILLFFSLVYSVCILTTLCMCMFCSWLKEQWYIFDIKMYEWQ